MTLKAMAVQGKRLLELDNYQKVDWLGHVLDATAWHDDRKQTRPQDVG